MNTQKILLAEDNVLNQEVTRDMLEVMGYSVDIANNGKEAVQMSQQSRYDIVFMDCQMPVMDGFEASRELRRLEKTNHHRHTIITLTGNAVLDDKEKYFDAGMDDFLCKPFSYKQLEEILAHYQISNLHDARDSR